MSVVLVCTLIVYAILVGVEVLVATVMLSAL